MLARANRVIRAEDFRAVVRRGRRRPTPAAVFYVMDRSAGDPARFGFIVSRAVGNSVERNRLRRQWRAISRELVDEGLSGHDVVLRALPGAVDVPWAALRSDARRSLEQETVR